VNDLSAEQRQHGFDFSNPLIGHGEIVVTENGKVCVFSFRERTDLVVIEREPRRAFGIKAERFQARNLLAVVGKQAGYVSSRRHVKQGLPRIQRRDIGGIGSHTGPDPGVDNSPERRAAPGR
jgi:hypothetical protein